LSNKILHINVQSSYDGALVYTLRLCKSLNQYDHKIVCCFRGNAYEEILKLGIKCDNLINNYNPGKRFLLLKYWKFFWFIRKNHFDFIHYHQGGIGVLLLSYFFRKNAKVIHHFHSGNLIGDNKKQNIPFIHVLVVKYLANKTYQVAVAEHVQKTYLQVIGQSKNLRLIRNSTPFSFVQKKEIKNGIGFIGRFTDEKGFLLIKSIAEELKVFNPSLKLFLMGEESKNILDQTNRLDSNVEIILPSFDVTQFYCSIDLLLFPSTAPEGMPLVVLEAISFDVGVIAYPLPGVKEVLGVDYQLLVNDWEEIINKIISYYAKEINLDKLSLIHKNISDDHKETEMLSSIRDIYEKIV
jgi:glycosyltransferase involved in cell wall biosynthesis